MILLQSHTAARVTIWIPSELCSQSWIKDFVCESVLNEKTSSKKEREKNTD